MLINRLNRSRVVALVIRLEASRIVEMVLGLRIMQQFVAAAPVCCVWYAPNLYRRDWFNYITLIDMR